MLLMLKKIFVYSTRSYVLFEARIWLLTSQEYCNYMKKKIQDAESSSTVKPTTKTHGNKVQLIYKFQLFWGFLLSTSYLFCLNHSLPFIYCKDTVQFFSLRSALMNENERLKLTHLITHSK